MILVWRLKVARRARCLVTRWCEGRLKVGLPAISFKAALNCVINCNGQICYTVKREQAAGYRPWDRRAQGVESFLQFFGIPPRFSPCCSHGLRIPMFLTSCLRLGRSTRSPSVTFFTLSVCSQPLFRACPYPTLPSPISATRAAG